MTETSKTMNRLNEVARSIGEAIAPAEVGGGGPLSFSFNGLATPPARAVHSLFGLFGRLDVPPGTWGVCFEPGSAPQVLRPGTYWLNGVKGASALVQLVDARLGKRQLAPVSGTSRDGWSITLQVVLVYEVTDPVQVARATEPVATLEALARAAILAQIEEMPHEALLGSAGAPEHSVAEHSAPEHSAPEHFAPEHFPDAPAGNANHAPVSRPGHGLDLVERGLLERLANRPSLGGLRVVDAAVIVREGDARLVGILQGEALNRIQAVQTHQTEAARAELQKLRLEQEVQTAQAERAVSLIQAETQVQLANLQEQVRLLEARTEAEVQEIRQVQEAREAERKRLAEEWRTAKELDLRSMEYQHAEALAIIQGTAQVTSEAAKSGLLGSLQGNNRRIELGGPGEADAVGAGIQALRGFREKISPPATHFLPRQSGSGLPGDGQERLRGEALRFERIPHSEHELVLKHGALCGARLWFLAGAPLALAGLRLEFTCPDGYPFLAPEIRIVSPGESAGYALKDWSPELFLADLAQQILLERMARLAQQARPPAGEAGE